MSDEKKLKKFRKKADKGDVSDYRNFQECYQLGIQGKVGVYVVKDPTRKSSTHDLNLSELRDLIVSILEDGTVSKFFSVKNKGFIRSVTVLHVANSSNPQSLLIDCFPEIKIHCVKIEKSHLDLNYLPSLLLSVPLNKVKDIHKLPKDLIPSKKREINEENEQETELNLISSYSERIAAKLRTYQITPSVLKLWNYPLNEWVNRETKIDLTPPLLFPGITENEEKSAKKPRIERLENDIKSNKTNALIGVNVGSVPENKQSALELIQLLKKQQQLQRKQEKSIEYVETISASDETAWKLLWSDELSFNIDKCLDDIEETMIKRASSNHIESFQKPLLVAAIDCEMCDTQLGLELTRLSVVDVFGTVKLDVLVKPELPILDYRTQYSGITEELLNPVTVSLAQAQVALMRLVSAETVLIGHSLENDLYCLNMSHRVCVDTALLYPHPKGFPLRRKLKILANDYLKQSIQQGNVTLLNDGTVLDIKEIEKEKLEGFGDIGKNPELTKIVEKDNTPVKEENNPLKECHDSIEDAKATLQLALLKMEKGPLFGIKDPEQQKIPLLQQLDESKTQSMLCWQEPRESCTSEVIGKEAKVVNGNTVKFERNGGMSQFGLEKCVGGTARAVRCDNVEETIMSACEFLHDKNVKNNEGEISSKMKFLYVGIDVKERNETEMKKESNEIYEKEKEIVKNCVSQLSATLSEKYEQEPGRGLIMLTSQMNTEETRKMLKQRRMGSSKALSAVVWNAELEAQLKELLKSCNHGYVGFIVV